MLSQPSNSLVISNPMNKNFPRHGGEGSTGLAPSKDMVGLAGVGQCTHKSLAPISLPNPHLSLPGNSGATLGWGSFFYVANVPGWLPVMTVVASKTTTAEAIVLVGPTQGSRKACNPRVYGTPIPLWFEADSNAPQPSHILGRVREGLGTTLPLGLNEAGSNEESGEGKGIR